MNVGLKSVTKLYGFGGTGSGLYPRRRHSALGWKSPLAFERRAA